MQGVERFLADGCGIVEGREELLFCAVHIGCVGYRVPMVDKAAIGRKIGGEILVADPSEKMTGAVQAIIDAVDVPEDPGVEGHTDGYFADGNADGIEPANGMIDGFHILWSGVQRGMVAGDGSIAVDEVIGHEVDVVDHGCHVLPVDRGFQIIGIAAGCKADLIFLPQLVAQQPDERGEMIFIVRGEGVAGDVLEGWIFPVEVDAVGMEIISELFDRVGKLAASAICGEYIRTGLAAAPAAERKDHFELGVLLFQGHHVHDSSGISCIFYMEHVAFQVTEAEDDMGQLVCSEAVDVSSPAGIIANDGQFFLAAGVGRLGKGALGQKDESDGEKDAGGHTIDL